MARGVIREIRFLDAHTFWMVVILGFVYMDTSMVGL
jgi:hypothetical protein